MATAVLDVTGYPFNVTLKDDDETILAEGTIKPDPSKSINAQVATFAGKKGFSLTGEPFDYVNGVVYRLRTRKG